MAEAEGDDLAHRAAMVAGFLGGYTLKAVNPELAENEIAIAAAAKEEEARAQERETGASGAAAALEGTSDRAASAVRTSVLTASAHKADLVKGIYEGGMKVWECTHDLVNYMIAAGVRPPAVTGRGKEEKKNHAGLSPCQNDTASWGVGGAQCNQMRRRWCGRGVDIVTLLHTYPCPPTPPCSPVPKFGCIYYYTGDVQRWRACTGTRMRRRTAWAVRMARRWFSRLCRLQRGSA